MQVSRGSGPEPHGISLHLPQLRHPPALWLLHLHRTATHAFPRARHCPARRCHNPRYRPPAVESLAPATSLPTKDSRSQSPASAKGQGDPSVEGSCTFGHPAAKSSVLRLHSSHGESRSWSPAHCERVCSPAHLRKACAQFPFQFFVSEQLYLLIKTHTVFTLQIQINSKRSLEAVCCLAMRF